MTITMNFRWRNNRSAAAALEVADPSRLLRGDADAQSPVLRLVLERARAGSQPGRRDDPHVLCLAVEGGGMRGAVTSGMCVVLEAAGLLAAFDRVYGVSAGALNGAAAAAGQAALNATHYQDAATRRVINPIRPLRGRPVIDGDFLFGDLIATRKPLSFAALSAGPEFRALATSVDARSLSVLKGFRDGAELMQGIRASASLPTLGGRPPTFRGERMVDGGLVEPLPFETALREGATHVMVLRSRPARYRCPRCSELAERLVSFALPEIGELLKHSAGVYNRQAEALERVMMQPAAGRNVMQVVVPDRARLIGRLEANGHRVVEALRLGAAAMAAQVFTESIDLCWQPVAYRTTAVPRCC